MPQMFEWYCWKIIWMTWLGLLISFHNLSDSYCPHAFPYWPNVCLLSMEIPSLAMHSCKLPMGLNSTGFMSLYILLASILFFRVVVSVFPTGCLPSAKWSRTNALGHISCAWWLYIRTDWFNMCAHWECTSLGSVNMEWAVVCAGGLTVCLWFLCTCVCWLCTCRHRLHEWWSVPARCLKSLPTSADQVHSCGEQHSCFGH